MPPIVQYRVIVILLLAFSALAAFFYFKVRSSIDTSLNTNFVEPARLALQHGKEEDGTAPAIFRQQYQHYHHSSSQHDAQNREQPSVGNEEPIHSETARHPVSDKLQQQPESATASTSTSASPPHADSVFTDSERMRLKAEEAERKRMKEEYRRMKEQQRRRKIEKLQRLRKLEMEPFPRLISTNNGRVADMNLRAFYRFCYGKDAGEGEGDKSYQSKVGVTTVTTALKANAPEGTEGKARTETHTVTESIDFGTYQEWIEYIHNKNTGQEQVPMSISMLPQQSESGGQHQSMPLRTHHRPLFLERPLRGWIINYTAIIEPCNRTLHTSAHCLGFLSQEHLYLVPSPKARKPPNRIQKKPPLESDQYEDLDVDGSVSSLAATATAAGTGGSSVTMDFHIFWRGSVTDKLALSVHAFLFTQPLERARLHLWIDSTDLAGGVAEDYTQNQYARDLVSEPLNRFIRFHQWNQTAQEAFAYPTPPPARLRSEDASDQHLQQDQGQIQQQENQTIQKPSVAPVALSDEARFLILYRYGGMYLDADVLLLRDMSPFYDSGKEFAYEWSSTQMYNTAVLRLKRGSGVARRILDRAKAKEKKFQEKQQRMKQREARLAHGTHGKRYSEESNSVNKHPITGPRSEKVHADWREDSFNIQLDKESPPALQPVPTSLELPIQPGSSPLAPASHFPVIEKEGEEDTLGHQHHDSLFASSPPSSLPISPIIQRRLIKRGEMRPDEIYHPARLRSYLRPQDGLLDNNGLTMMPVSIFDPLWLRVDGAEPMVGLQNDSERMMVNLKTFPDVFTRTGTVCPLQQDMQEALGPAGREGGFTAGPEVFFMGAYAYHWHNSWLTPIDPHSWMGLMKQAYEEFLAGERPNLYGEWFRGDSVAIFKA